MSPSFLISTIKVLSMLLMFSRKEFEIFTSSLLLINFFGFTFYFFLLTVDLICFLVYLIIGFLFICIVFLQLVLSFSLVYSSTLAQNKWANLYIFLAFPSLGKWFFFSIRGS